jgi:hypothetical protein
MPLSRPSWLGTGGFGELLTDSGQQLSALSVSLASRPPSSAISRILKLHAWVNDRRNHL